MSEGVITDIRNGLGCGGFSSHTLLNRRVSVNVARVVAALCLSLVGFTALICGIGTCVASSLVAMSLAGVAAILLAGICLFLSVFWGYGVFVSYKNRS